MPKIIFGADKFSELPKRVREYGRNVLLVTGGSSFAASGKLEQLLSSFAHDKITCYQLSIDREPSPRMIDKAADEFRRKPVNAVVAVGGGSVLDAGKAISAMLGEEGAVSDYLEGVGTKKLSGVKAPFFAVPTTSGTGSEATKNAVLSVVGEDGFKKSLRHDNYMPDVALIDPELMMSCPKSITAACGLDTLSQLIESYISTNANPVTDALAKSGIAAFQKGFMASYTDGTDLEARGQMAYASLMSGITLSHAGLGTIHGIAGALGGIVSVPHGVACGTLLAGVMKEIICRIDPEDKICAVKLAEIGRILEGSEDKDDSYYRDNLITILEAYREKTEIPRLGVYGMTEALIPNVLKNTDNKSSPVKLDSETITRILLSRI